MVVLMVAVLLGGAGAALYAMTGGEQTPVRAPHFRRHGAGTQRVRVDGAGAGRIPGTPFQRTHQPDRAAAGGYGGWSAPNWSCPNGPGRSELTLTTPDGTVALTGDAAGYTDFVFSQNGEYDLQLTLYRDHSAEAPGLSSGWYAYHAGFTVNMQPKAVLSTDSAPQGTIVAVWVTGILDGSTPTLETDLGTVWFRPTQTGYMGYIPVTYNAEGGEHIMTLTCGELVQELTLSVTEMSATTVQTESEPEIAGRRGGIPERDLAAVHIQRVGQTLAGGVRSAQQQRRHRALRRPPDGGRQLGRAVHRADLRQCRGGAARSAPPRTARWVYAGTLALSGGTVVIDHGCGVKSYLFGMGEVLVQKGQSVTKGDQVGTATDAHDLIFELRIGSKSVDPAPAIKGGQRAAVSGKPLIHSARPLT